MKKIIVPVDFSVYSEYALEVAAKLAKKSNAEIFVLHMLEMSDSVITKSDQDHNMETIFFLRLAEKRFGEFLDKPYLEDVTVTPIVKQSKVFNEVSEVAKEHNVDLIVMGSKGTTGISEIFVGSNTEKVVRYSDIPVLVIKSKPESVDFNKVIYATDFTKKAVSSYNKAIKAFNALGSDLYLLNVNLPGELFNTTTEIETRVKDFLKMAEGNLDSYPKVHFVADTTVEYGVLNFAKKINADLIAIPTHGRTGLARFFEGSISEDIANHSDIPVMTFKV